MAAAPFEQPARKVGAGAQLRDRDLRGAGAGVEFARLLELADRSRRQRHRLRQPGGFVPRGVELPDRLVDVDAEPAHLAPSGQQLEEGLTERRLRRSLQALGRGQGGFGGVAGGCEPGGSGGFSDCGVLVIGVAKQYCPWPSGQLVLPVAADAAPRRVADRA